MLVFLDAGFSSQKLAHCLNSNKQKMVYSIVKYEFQFILYLIVFT